MAAIDIKSLSDEKIADFLNSFDTILSDCDGVLWIDANPLPGSADAMRCFRDRGKKIFYITNNCTMTKEDVVRKCERMNLTATTDEILCAANLMASYLRDLDFRKKVYMIGSQGLATELERVGIKHCGIERDEFVTIENSTRFVKDPDVGAVVIGFDGHLSYPKMIKAATYLNDESVLFLGTHADEKYPNERDDVVVPGTGVFIQSLETCTGRKATVVGKPETYGVETIKRRCVVDPGRTLMIGDRANTDVLLGTRCGFKTLLVLSGMTTLEEIARWKASSLQEERNLVPDYYIDSLGELVPYLRKLNR